MTDLPNVVGLTIEQATEVLRPHGINWVRPTMEDGKILMGTQDMRRDRLNVALKEGVIAAMGKIG